jgi:hypothetical protein
MPITVNDVATHTIPTARMSIKIYDENLDADFRKYCHQAGISLNKATNILVNLLFELSLNLSQDRLKNLSIAIDIVNQIDWDKVESLHEAIREEPLTRNVNVEDVVGGLLSKGLTQYQKSVNTPPDATSAL